MARGKFGEKSGPGSSSSNTDSAGEDQLHQNSKTFKNSKSLKNSESAKINNPEDEMEIVWRNIFIMLYLHWGALVGCYYWFSFQCKWQSILFGFFYGYLSAFGVTCGTHRLWAHKAYRANLPLRILLAFMQTSACQNSIHEWSRDHRVHHKFSETDGDPHNARRGFFFAHMGWLLMKKHPDVKVKGKQVDMSDLESDPVVMFQKKFFIPLTILACFFLPSVIPWYFWGENGYFSYYLTLTRYVFSLHATWLVNSAAHLWGFRPYDKNINPAENKLVSIITPGEGWHNYHHVFPWDYKAAELGTYKHNFSTAFIDFFAWIGWAYDLKTVPERIVFQRVQRTGDHTHYSRNYPTEKSTLDKNRNLVQNKGSKTKNLDKVHSDATSWGWDDKDTPKEDKDVTIIHCRKSVG